MPKTTQVPNPSRTRRDRVLLARYHRTRGRRERDELVERFMPLARNIARRYASGGTSLDELTQVAAIGLINAVDRFDPARGIAFSTFAVPTISGELKRHFRDHTWAVRPPRDLLERTLRVNTAVDKHVSLHARSPAVDELTEQLGLSEEEVLEALQARQAASALSLQTPAGKEDDEPRTLEDRLGTEDEEFDHAERRVLLERLLNTLSPRDRVILRMRMSEDMTQAEIGRAVGVSQMQISRIVRQATDRMRIVAERAAA